MRTARLMTPLSTGLRARRFAMIFRSTSIAGTIWTRAFAVVNYEQAVEPFLKTSRLSASERAMLMGGACAKAYNWSPKKG